MPHATILQNPTFLLFCYADSHELVGRVCLLLMAICWNRESTVSCEGTLAAEFRFMLDLFIELMPVSPMSFLQGAAEVRAGGVLHARHRGLRTLH